MIHSYEKGWLRIRSILNSLESVSWNQNNSGSGSKKPNSYACIRPDSGHYFYLLVWDCGDQHYFAIYLGILLSIKCTYIRIKSAQQCNVASF